MYVLHFGCPHVRTFSEPTNFIFFVNLFLHPPKEKKELYITIIQKQLKSGVFYFGYEYILAKYYIFIYFYMINTLQFIV